MGSGIETRVHHTPIISVCVGGGGGRGLENGPTYTFGVLNSESDGLVAEGQAFDTGAGNVYLQVFKRFVKVVINYSCHNSRCHYDAATNYTRRKCDRCVVQQVINCLCSVDICKKT